MCIAPNSLEKLKNCTLLKLSSKAWQLLPTTQRCLRIAQRIILLPDQAWSVTDSSWCVFCAFLICSGVPSSQRFFSLMLNPAIWSIVSLREYICDDTTGCAGSSSLCLLDMMSNRFCRCAIWRCAICCCAIAFDTMTTLSTISWEIEVQPHQMTQKLQ